MALVYMATNTVNGKRYIGYSSNPLVVRMGQHFNAAYDKNPRMRFHRAIRKYGKEAFNWKVVRDNLSENDGFALEKSLIDNIKPEYNLSAGGKCTTPAFRPVICLTDNKRYSSVQEAARFYEIDKSRVTQLCKTGTQTRSGLRFSYEGSSTQRRAAPRRKIICINDGKIYESALDASIYYGVNVGSINQVCLGRYVYAKGLHFSYYDHNMSENERLNLLRCAQQKHDESLVRKRLGISRANSRPVICLNDGKRYKTARAAVTAYKISSFSVWNSCKNGGVTHSGLRFMYADQDVAPTTRKLKLRRRIVNLDNGTVYKNTLAAARDINRSDTAIRNAIKNNTRCAGMHFAYAA